mgnify:CR=1 FL=1
MTELMIGHCRYCGDPRQVEMEVDASQEEADIQATEECDCLEAKEARRKREQAEACERIIETMIAGSYPEIADLLLNSIGNIQEYKFEKLTIDTGAGKKFAIKRTKDGIKVEAEEKKKDEATA